MHFSRIIFATAACIVGIFARSGFAAEDNLVLANDKDAQIEFERSETGWRWARLITPEKPEGWRLTDLGETISAGDGDATDALSPAWALIDQAPDKLVFAQIVPNSGLEVRRVFSFGPAPHVMRIETSVRSLDQPKLLHHVGLLSLQVGGESFQVTGPSPASFPVFGGALFAGIEDVSGESAADADTLRLWQTPDLSVGEEWQLVASVVVGWHAPRAAVFLPGESRTRDAFLQYLDTIRVQPADINLHSDTWWTLPMPFTEDDVRRDVATLRHDFFERTGLFFNTYALDLGWSDPHTLWGIDAQNFPAGFGPIKDALAEMNCKVGLWVSPGSGYAPGLDNSWLASQGYETTPVDDEGNRVACFALGGRYQREFTQTLLGYAKEYELGHVIFDGLVHSCDDPTHLHATGVGSVYAIDAGLKDVMDQLRRQNPNIMLEPLACGHPPSPWWNVHSPFLLGPAGDDVPFGRVPCPDWTESLISARDIAYRAGQESWLVRTQAIETFDMIVQSPGVFENMAVMAAGRGRWFMSANIRPELMKPADWDFLAALVRWQRANKQCLVDARMIGGSPAKREAYGYMFHNADRDLYCIRNPWIEERTIHLPARVTASRDFDSIYPRRTRLARIGPDDDGVDVVLAPYETMFLETVGAADDEPLPARVEAPQGAIAASEPQFEALGQDDDGDIHASRYHWAGALTVPDVANAELCILVEGVPAVGAAQGGVTINGRAAKVVRTTSVGQFGAAVDPSPENWTWFIVPVAAGSQNFDVTVDVLLASASVGVYLRGAIAATSDPVPDDIVAFPVYQPEQRAWSQTLQPLTRFEIEGANEAAATTRAAAARTNGGGANAQ